MKAAVYDRYGAPEVVRVEDVDQPVPNAGELLVRVHAATVNRTDCGWRTAHPWFIRFFIGWRGPRRRILGMEYAGVVEAVGAGVEEFSPGDEVFGVKGFGAHAELTIARATGAVAHKPANTTFDEAAAVCDGACIALSCLRRGGLGEGHELLVYGASGSVGTAAVQLAKHHYGVHVTAVCDTKHVELARTLGADEVLDYTRGEDFTKNGKRYDVVFDAVGKQTFFRCRGSLKEGGTFVTTDGLVNAPLSLVTKRAAIGIAKYGKEDVVLLKELIEAGKYRAVIDRRYPLDDIVEAYRYVDTGQKTGNVVVTLS
jgi:NADPH:quinone reductase-like Zn-dependent oxidoreductase